MTEVQKPTDLRDAGLDELKPEASRGTGWTRRGVLVGAVGVSFATIAPKPILEYFANSQEKSEADKQANAELMASFAAGAALAERIVPPGVSFAMPPQGATMTEQYYAKVSGQAVELNVTRDEYDPGKIVVGMVVSGAADAESLAPVLGLFVPLRRNPAFATRTALSRAELLSLMAPSQENIDAARLSWAGYQNESGNFVRLESPPGALRIADKQLVGINTNPQKFTRAVTGFADRFAGVAKTVQ